MQASWRNQPPSALPIGFHGRRKTKRAGHTDEDRNDKFVAAIRRLRHRNDLR